MERDMENLRSPRRNLRLALLSMAFVLFAVVPGSLSAAKADSVGTLRLSGTFTIDFKPAACPAGAPLTTSCYGESGGGTISGLGVFSADYVLMFDDYGAACGRIRALIPMVVAGKGQIDLMTRSTAC